jgi:S1-C subfamily serine protease
MLKKLKTLIKGIAFVLSVSLISLNAPYIHKYWLRNKVADNVVMLTYGPYIPSGGGTGFVVKTPSGNKVTVTNRHICDELNKNPIYAKTRDGRYSKLEILEVSMFSDLCILSPVPGLKGLSLGGEVYNGDNIYVVGHPFLWETLMTEGEVSGIKNVILLGETDRKGSCKYLNGRNTIFGCVEIHESIMSSVKTAPGNSGSPVVNNLGQVVGVLFAGTQNGYSAIVRIKHLKELIKGY